MTKLPRPSKYKVENRTWTQLNNDLSDAMELMDDAQFYLSVIRDEIEKRLMNMNLIFKQDNKNETIK